jgi:hypothetical protein
MRGIWSFWSRPHFAGSATAWASEFHHLLSWVLSLESARKHCQPLALYTDTAGARLLVDRVGLCFDELHVVLDRLEAYDPAWWAMGKLCAYREQTEPFVHIDNDVFLFKPLPQVVTGAPVFAQNPEPFVRGQSFYQPEVFETALKGSADAWLPEEWLSYRAAGIPQRGECCGILGGNDLGFVHHYAEQALRLIEHPANRRAFDDIADKVSHNTLFEQYFLAACIEHHRGHPESPWNGIFMRYLFDSMDEAFTPAIAKERGYTHLLAGAKRNPTILQRLEDRVGRDYPEMLDRCASVVQRLASTSQQPSHGRRQDDLNRTGGR